MLHADAVKRDAALKQAQDDAARAGSAATSAAGAVAGQPFPATLSVPATTPPSSAVVTMPPNDKDAAGKPFFNAQEPNGTFNIGGLKIMIGGFI
jgi:hypothetical protein